jgi:hypothetical protein
MMRSAGAARQRTILITAIYPDACRKVAVIEQCRLA